MWRAKEKASIKEKVSAEVHSVPAGGLRVQELQQAVRAENPAETGAGEEEDFHYLCCLSLSSYFCLEDVFLEEMIPVNHPNRAISHPQISLPISHPASHPTSQQASP